MASKKRRLARGKAPLCVRASDSHHAGSRLLPSVRERGTKDRIQPFVGRPLRTKKSERRNASLSACKRRDTQIAPRHTLEPLPRPHRQCKPKRCPRLPSCFHPRPPARSPPSRQPRTEPASSGWPAPPKTQSQSPQTTPRRDRPPRTSSNRGLPWLPSCLRVPFPPPSFPAPNLAHRDFCSGGGIRPKWPEQRVRRGGAIF